VPQVDGYAAGRGLTAADRPGGPVTLAFCWSHARRFHEIARAGHAPVAVEAEIRGLDPEARRAARDARSRPIVDASLPWLEDRGARLPGKSRLAEAIRYALKLWTGLTLFLEDGRVELDTNVVEREIRPVALTRKNALFAGSDRGAEHWAVLASLIGTAKLNGVEPHVWLTSVLERIIAGHPQSRIDELMPWVATDA